MDLLVKPLRLGLKALRLQLRQPPWHLQLPATNEVEARGVTPALTCRGDLCLVATEAMPQGTLVLREQPLAVARCDAEASYNMLLLLKATAESFEVLQESTVGLTPREGLPREGQAHATRPWLLVKMFTSRSCFWRSWRA